MLQIQHIGKYRIGLSTGAQGGGTGQPNLLNMNNRDVALVQTEALRAWVPEAKEALAGYVQSGQLAVREMTCVHESIDSTPLFDEPVLYSTGETKALEAAVLFKKIYNKHLLNTAYHTAADVANPIVTADPTDVPSLVIFLAAVKINYNAHLADGAIAHLAADTVNVAVETATDLPTSVIALERLFYLFHAHKEFCTPTGLPLTPDAIIAY